MYEFRTARETSGVLSGPSTTKRRAWRNQVSNCSGTMRARRASWTCAQQRPASSAVIGVAAGSGIAGVTPSGRGSSDGLAAMDSEEGMERGRLRGMPERLAIGVWGEKAQRGLFEGPVRLGGGTPKMGQPWPLLGGTCGIVQDGARCGFVGRCRAGVRRQGGPTRSGSGMRARILPSLLPASTILHRRPVRTAVSR